MVVFCICVTLHAEGNHWPNLCYRHIESSTLRFKVQSSTQTERETRRSRSTCSSIHEVVHSDGSMDCYMLCCLLFIELFVNKLKRMNQQYFYYFGAGNLPRPTRGWTSVSSNLAGPKRRITTSASLPSKPSSAPQTGFARKKSFKSQILDLSSCTVQEYIYVGGIDPLVAAIACESSFSTAILTHGLLLFSRVPIHRRFKGWYKGLKSRVVQVKYEEKGVTLLWI